MDEAGVLVTGASGQVGTAFRSVIPKARFLARSDLDLSQPERIYDEVTRRSPLVVINCAAHTQVDRAEEEEELATAINGYSVGEMARACADLGIPFITFSTDYVFDGTSEIGYVESDPVAPINSYGRSKLVGERLAAEMYPETLIVRTSWVLSATHDNFVSTMLRSAAKGRQLRVVDDQWGRPTIADDLAVGVWNAVEAGATGVLHLTNGGEATWFDVARAAITRGGFSSDRLIPCSSEEFPTPAARPACSVLNSERLETLGLDDLPPWQDAIPSLAGAQVQRLGVSPS